MQATATLAASPSEALRQLSDHPHYFSVIIMDQDLPTTTGRHLAEQIHWLDAIGQHTQMI